MYTFPPKKDIERHFHNVVDRKNKNFVISSLAVSQNSATATADGFSQAATHLSSLNTFIQTSPFKYICPDRFTRNTAAILTVNNKLLFNTEAA